MAYKRAAHPAATVSKPVLSKRVWGLDAVGLRMVCARATATMPKYSSKLKRVGIENPVAVVLLKRRVPSSTFRR
jgi:hypothetical protein